MHSVGLKKSIIAMILMFIFLVILAAKADDEGKYPWEFVSACRTDSADPYVGPDTILALIYAADWSAPAVSMYKIIEADSENAQKGAKKIGLPVFIIKKKYFIAWPMMGTVCVRDCSQENDIIFEPDGGMMSAAISLDVFNYLKQRSFSLVKNLDSVFLDEWQFDHCLIMYTETERYLLAVGRK